MRSELGSVREVSPGLWVVQVSLGYDHVTGRRVRPSRTVRGIRRDAERMLVRMLTEHGLTKPGGLTLTEYFETLYLPRLRERVAAKQMSLLTVDGYEERWKRHIKPHLGSLRLAMVQPYQLDRWLTTLATTKKARGDGTLSGRDQLHSYRLLSAALNTAVRWRLLEGNPLKCVDAPEPDDYEPDLLDCPAANAYLDLFAGHALEPIVAIAIAGGLRRSELAALEWTNDVDFSAGGVWITKGRHHHKGEVFEKDPKSRTSRRFVALPSWCLKILQRHRGIGRVCGTLNPTQLAAHYKAVVTRSGLAWVPMKNLRHSSATIALGFGGEIVSVSRRLGHSTTAVTDSFYLKPGREADARVAAAMEALRPAKRQRRRA